MKENLIRYANCWEDSDNILATLKSGSRVLSVCSGGDNTIVCLLKDPEKVVAFDSNINQIHLCKLKISAFKCLEHEEILELLGVKKGDAYSLFRRLEGDLDEKSYEFFEEHREFFEEGIVNIGKFEHYFQLMRNYISPVFASKRRLDKLAACGDIHEQIRYYDRYVATWRLNLIFNVFFGFKVMGKYGRDPSCYDYVPDKEKTGSNIREIFERGMHSVVNKTNPYLNYVLGNRFTEDALPEYLKRENYEIIRERICRISFVNGMFSEISEDEKFDFFNLSDIFEYMSEETYRENVDKLKALSHEGSKVIYYNMQNPRYIDGPEFARDKELSERLCRSTRSYFYRDFLVYERK